MKEHDIKIKFVITDRQGAKVHEGSFKLNDEDERKACAERFNTCLIDGYTVTTRRLGVVNKNQEK